MANFLILFLELENNTYYKTSIFMDAILLILSLVAYFSNDFVVSEGLVVFASIVSCAFAGAIICSIIRFRNRKKLLFRVLKLHLKSIICTFQESNLDILK